MSEPREAAAAKKEVEYQRKRIKTLEKIVALVNTCDGLPEFLTLVANLVSDSNSDISASLLTIASEMNDALAALDKVE